MEKKAQNKCANISTAGKLRDPSTHKWIGNKHIVKGGLFKDIKNIPFDRKVDVPHGVCFNCWEHGHSRQKCSKPDRGDHCRNCGRIGIRVATCPRCSEAHRNYWRAINNPQSQTAQDLKLELAKIRKAQKWNKADDKVGLYHFAQVKTIPFDSEIDIPSKVCPNCWKSRHPGQCENDQLHAHCFNCGRIGVYITDCPRCSYAYPQYYNKKVEALPVKGEIPTKPKKLEPQPEPKSELKPEFKKILPKPSVFKTISPTSKNIRSFSDVLKDKNKDNGYVSQNESVSTEDTDCKIKNSSEETIVKIENHNEQTVVKTENSMFKFTRDYIGDIKTLMEIIKHLSVTNQDAIVSEFMIDRRKFVEKMINKRTNV